MLPGKKLFTSPKVTGGVGIGTAVLTLTQTPPFCVLRAQLSASQNVSHLGILPSMRALIPQVHSGAWRFQGLLRLQVGPMPLGQEPVLA